MIEIGLVEDNQILRSNYEDFFKGDQDFSIVFSVEDLNRLQTISHSFQPNIILLNLVLPSGNSLNSIHKLKQFFPSSKIIILSSIANEETTKTVFSNGANGFLLKSSSLPYIRDSLLQVAVGGIPLSPLIASHIINFKKEESIAQTYPSLTKRELQLVSLLKTGIANKTAAMMLNVTFFTINQHLKNIYTKLKINSKGELIAMSCRFNELS